MNKEIKDNFLKENDLTLVKEEILSNRFPWFFSPTQTASTPKDSSFFFHCFYRDNRINSNFFNLIEPFLKILNPHSLINVRANCSLNRIKSNSNFHTDDLNSKNLTHKTAIFYLNTNNGYTEFEKDKEKIKSIENRLVIFPSQLSHRAVGQTDKDRRIVINFNFYDGS